MTDFTGRAVLVTGATGGIGAATVRRLVGRGATVYAGGRNTGELAKLADETGATPVPFDLTSEDEIHAAVAGLELWGVVNCGGFGGEIATPQDTDIAVFDRVISVNARGSLLVIKHVTPGLIQRGRGGSIVNVSSQASLVALPGHISYGSSKAAVDNITRVSALELGKHNIRVNSVNPTVVMTDMSAYYWGRPDVGPPFLAQMPLGRWATEDEIAGPIAFLLSDDAAMITGVSSARRRGVLLPLVRHTQGDRCVGSLGLMISRYAGVSALALLVTMAFTGCASTVAGTATWPGAKLDRTILTARGLPAGRAVRPHHREAGPSRR